MSKPYEEYSLNQERKLSRPRCKECKQLLLAKCDRSKPSEYVDWVGILSTKDKPSKLWMFPTNKEQSKLCFYCEGKLNPGTPGKES